MSKNGPQLETNDRDFRVHVGGLLQFDAGGNVAGGAVQFGPGGTGEFQDGTVFRRARNRIDGQMYQHFEWVAEFDFANSIENDNKTSTQTNGAPSFVNVWAGVTDVPVLGNVRVGWMKETFNFSHLENARFLSFMERPPGLASLSLRSPGFLVTNWTEDQRVTWAVGFFHVQNNNFGFGIGDGRYAETGQLTFLPVFEDDGRELLHLGVGASHLDQDQVDLRGRPSVWTMSGTNP